MSRLASAPRRAAAVAARRAHNGLRLVAGRTGALREGARRERPGRRLLWLTVAAALTLGPLGLVLARAPQHEASMLLFAQRVDPYTAVGDPAYYRRLVGDPVLREQMRLNVGRRLARYEDVSIRRASRAGVLVLAARADTPADARRFVNALAPQIAGATQRDLSRRARLDATALRDRLRQRGLSRRERARLRQRLRRLDGLRPIAPTRVLPGAAAPRPELDRWADRLVDDLPGGFPPRPAPAWAALAGLLLAVTLWAVALVVAPPRHDGGGSAPPPD